MIDNILIGDIGGTNARFAMATTESTGYRDERVYKCADFATPEDAIDDYLKAVNVSSLDLICLAAAGPVIEGGVNITNNHWRVHENQLASRFEVANARVLNDFEAVAQGLPHFRQDDLEFVGPPVAIDLSRDFTVGVIGPGTGLGAAGLVRRGGYTIPLVGEAGHVGFAPENALQRDVWNVLHKRFGRVSDERLLSGRGIENVFVALAEVRGEASLRLSAAEIFQQAATNSLAGEAISMVFEVLGQVAGNYALAIGAFDGIYIGGGIMQRYHELLMGSHFRAGFDNKGRHRHVMERIPVQLITHSQPGLFGTAAWAAELARS